MLKTLIILLGISCAGALVGKTLPKINIPLSGNNFVFQPYMSGSVVHPGQFNPPNLSYWGSYPNTLPPFYSFRNTLELRHIESTDLPVTFDYKLIVTGLLVTYTIGSATGSAPIAVSLEINYDPNTQKTCRRLDYYAYSNAYKSEFTIQSVTLTSQNAPAPPQTYIDVSKIVELNFSIEQTMFSSPIFNTVPLLHSSCVDNVSNELVISWDTVGFAEEYELEIAFKDNYAADGSALLPPTIGYDFKENSTRIVTKQNFYRVPLVYERGYLVYRIRAIGMGGTDWNKRIPCKWSALSSGIISDPSVHRFGPIFPHVQDKINWQLSTTYSDEGKRKDVVQYYDGLYMSRQTVTGVSQTRNMFTENVLDNNIMTPYSKNTIGNLQVMHNPTEVLEKNKLEEVFENDKQERKFKIPSGTTGMSTNGGVVVSTLFPTGCTYYGSDKIKEIIAQEVIYDFNGRPALQILPVPTGTHRITYIKRLNKNMDGVSYSWKDFDTLDPCLLTAHKMKDDATGYALGAAAYYSPSNPNKLGYNAFIPDSKGYPFSRVQYTFDNTGKTFRQAGVGIVHELDIPGLVGHETKFYYGKPNQPELDRMFGNEVGYAIRYQKNMVIDPNGQVSVSYLNPEGKTIATALTGIRPNNLLPPDNESNPSVTIPVDLLASNIPDSLEHSLTITEPFTVAATATYNFSYTLRGQSLSYSYCQNNGICLDCIYELDLKLISNEACSDTFVYSYSGTFGDLINSQDSSVNIDLGCFNNRNHQGFVQKTNNFPTPFSRTLPPGSYTLVKTLKVNKSAADGYVKLVFKDTCMSVLQGFLNDEQSKIDTSDCYQSCKKCTDNHPSHPDSCISLCPQPMNECERARHMLLVDVTPGGQYAQFDITSTGYDASNYPLSVFNPSNSLPSHIDWHTISGLHPVGTTVPTLDSIIEHWDATLFPQLFLPYHPEACMLDWCDQKDSGRDYDLKMEEAITYQAAVDSGLITTPTASNPVYEQILNHDPYFTTTPGNLTTEGTAFLVFLKNPCNGILSLDSLAEDAAYCQDLPATQQILLNAQNTLPNTSAAANAILPQTPHCTIPSGYHSTHIFGADQNTQDYEWQNLRGLYLTFKEKYLYQSRRDYSIDHDCFNGCIGVQNFWFSFPMLWIPYSFNSYPYFYGDHNISHTGYSWSAEGEIPINTNDMCGFTRNLYEHKVKRFTNRYDGASHTTMDIPLNLSGINLYDDCPSPSNINNIQTQLGGVENQYLCDSIVKGSNTGVSTDSCWSSSFISLLNQYLPSVATAPVILTASQVSNYIKNVVQSSTEFPLVQAEMEYVGTTHEYHISFIATGDGACRFTFPATLIGSAPKPISSVCCPQTLDAHTISFTLKFTDGSTSYVEAATACQLPICPRPIIPIPADSCTARTPFTMELFSFLEILKRPIIPHSGEYQNDNLSHQTDHLMDPYSPLQYAIDQANCTLTFSPAGVSSGGNTIVQATNFKTLNGNNLQIRPKKPDPCTITFTGCDWMNANATLVSIRPYFPNGIANVVTHEFILTYVKPNAANHLDTFTVQGNSGCFPVNDCHTPYLCDDDTNHWKPRPYVNECVHAKYLIADYDAHTRYGRWLDSMKADLLAKYYAKCMQSIETMNYDYPDIQFHYTLYYYDQAGNLVRTVPPNGVKLLPPSDVAQIDTARIYFDLIAYPTGSPSGYPALKQPKFPTHSLVTNYKYNSLNQNTWQITPDAGKTDFFYDKLGRIAASQNAKQIGNGEYSYSWYDKLGRIVEGGKIKPNTPLLQTDVDDYNNWQPYLYGISDRTEITYTKYDDFFSLGISTKFGTDGQQNLRGRVASILSFEDKGKQLTGTYRHATSYSYDVTGNVPIVIQSYPGTLLEDKVIAYNFDLLTGKINEVRYEPGLQDEFRHKYFYDDELRLRKVQTSTKGIVWETDAEYFYYKHGPLARTELGDLKVQGLDYIYTLQGWIKGVNGTAQDPTQDAGRDGIALNDPKLITPQINGQICSTYVENVATYNSTGSGYHTLHNPVAADAFGYVLGYYNDLVNPDYEPIDPSVSTTVTMDAATAGVVKPLYNGNISRMYTWLQGQNMGGLGMNYLYDQLNRLKSQQAFTIATTGSQALVGVDAYGMKLTYDPNGNIMTLDRNGRPLNENMDNLNYRYFPNTNKLEYVKDHVSNNSNYPEPTPVNGTVTDIDAQYPGNYKYDEIGNLTFDNSEGITNIQWNLQNKITGITKTGAQIDFAYDAMGIRVYKKYASGSTVNETYYVRDAQGNTLATYEVKPDGLHWQEQDLYGSSRLGLWHPGIKMDAATTGLTGTINWQNIYR